MIVELGIAFCTTIAGIAGDALGILTRPVVFLGYCGLVPEGLLVAFSSSGLLNGFVGTVSVIVLGISLATICKPFGNAGQKLGAIIFGVPLVCDAVMQMPSLVGLSSAYPPSQTGAFTLPQFIFGAWAVLYVFSEGMSKWMARYFRSGWFFKLSNAVWLRNMAGRFEGAPATFFHAASVVLLVSIIVPEKAWEVLFGFFEVALECAKAALAAVYQAVTFGLEAMERLWQILKDAVWSLIQHPLVAKLHRMLIAPLWMLLTPWPLPLSTFAVAYSCALGALAAVNGGDLLLCVALSSAGLAAAACSVVLSLDAAGRCHPALADPLQWRAVFRALQLLARVVSLPWAACAEGRRLLELLVRPLLGRLVAGLAAALELAVENPPLGIAGVVGVNYALFTSAIPLKPLLDAALASGGALLFSAGRRLVRAVLLPVGGAEGGEGSGDLVLAVAVVAASQVAAFRIAWRLLFRLQLSAAAVDGQGGGEPSGAELNRIAEGLSDPRQCGLCCFGPVDYGGCSDLRAHHGERGASNCCPRCGWFAPSLSDWPCWDAALRVEGWGVLSKVTWHEVNLVLRAAAKALLVPYALLYASHRLLQLPVSLSAALALGYLIPWARLNCRAFRELHSVGGRRPQAPALPTQADDASCGAQRGGGGLGAVSACEALEALLGNVPHRVFLAPGDRCAVCLEAFPPEAADAAASLEGAEAAEALRGLQPAVVALRCGHPLHAECAEACVANAGGQHVRCPLCREPCTLLAAAGARLFT